MLLDLLRVVLELSEQQQVAALGLAYMQMAGGKEPAFGIGAKVLRSNCQLGLRPSSQLRRVFKRASVMVDSYNSASQDL